MDTQPEQNRQQDVQPEFASSPNARVPLAVWVVVGGPIFAIGVVIVIAFTSYIGAKSMHAYDRASYQNGYDFALRSGREGFGRTDTYGQLAPENVCWTLLTEARRSNTPPSNDEDFLVGCYDGLAKAPRRFG